MLKYIVASLFILNALLFSANFLNEQKRYPRVRKAIEDKEQIIKLNLQNNNISINKLNIIIIAYKEESILEIYAKNNTDKTYKKITQYSIASKSGVLGPKRMEGDLQVPEGFYYIDRFNPASSYYLSLGINYPNKSDQIKGKRNQLGGDIFIHGSEVTIGCIPMTDDKIKEIYLYAVYSKNNGQTKIPVYIFPFKMTEENIKNRRESDKLINFWKNIKVGYDVFINSKKEIIYKIDENGNYKY
ncbi:L,D-transpeptidase family protein [Brachyspira pilosicoli]|uniref:L,D-transpeptidase family protein n=1 Tax=Brachyspira pilosicoli TaxID=52584 RepID=UPI003006F2C0